MIKPYKKVIADKDYKLTLGRRQSEKMTKVTTLVDETPTTFIKKSALQMAQNIVDEV